ncbi:MAG: 26S protease regulatory subunit [Candidatus Nanosalina sp.]
MEGGDRYFEPVPKSELLDAIDELDWSAELDGPEYEEVDYGGPGQNWTGSETVVSDASIELNGAGPPVTVNLSAERGKMWYEVSSSAYQDKGLQAVRQLSEQLDLEDAGSLEQTYTWDDFAGYPEIKEDVRRDVVWPMRNPQLFEDMNMESDHVMLYGPPGTGKTLLGKVIAEQTDAEFYRVEIGEMIDKYVGESEENVHQLFQEARETAPSVIFIDEIEAFGRDRDDQTTSTGKNIVGAFLSELDGLDRKDQVTAIGATNKMDNLDPAFVRPGRFGSQYEIGEPDRSSREEIFGVHLAEPGENQGTPAVEGIDYEELARKTDGYVGADIKELIEQASRQSIVDLMQQEGIEHVEQVNFRNYEDVLRLDAQDLLDQVREEGSGTGNIGFQ